MRLLHGDVNASSPLAWGQSTNWGPQQTGYFSCASIFNSRLQMQDLPCKSGYFVCLPKSLPWFFRSKLYSLFLSFFIGLISTQTNHTVLFMQISHALLLLQDHVIPSVSASKVNNLHQVRPILWDCKWLLIHDRNLTWLQNATAFRINKRFESDRYRFVLKVCWRILWSRLRPEPVYTVH
jgi:hypothetical protein